MVHLIWTISYGVNKEYEDQSLLLNLLLAIRLVLVIGSLIPCARSSDTNMESVGIKALKFKTHQALAQRWILLKLQSIHTAKTLNIYM